jgi:hypothetical protein
MSTRGARTRRAARRWLLPALSALPLSLAAQRDTAGACRVTGTVFEPSFAVVHGVSPTLPPEHWAVRAAERLHGAGLAPGYLPAQGAVPRAVVFAALLQAGGEVFTFCRNPRLREWEPLLDEWLDRFLTEFPESRRGPRRVQRLGARAGAGYAESAGRLSPVIGFHDAQREPRPVPDRAGPFARAAGGVMLRGAVLAAGDVVLGAGTGDAPRWEVAAGARGWQLSAGRAEVRYGPGRAGGVALSPRQPLPRVELQRTRPLRLPGPLAHAGRVTGHVFAGPMADAERHPTDPWMFGARVALQPHPRLTLGIDRAAIFGGAGRPATVGKLAGMAVGVIRSDFENQVLSFEARWRLPTEAVLPVTVYAEWGADDGAGALDEQPGWVAGVSLPWLPGVPQLSAGVEAAGFTSCCGHGAWYYNTSFPGNWARGDQPLGHPLGGEGWQGAAYAAADLLGGRLRLEGRAFQREREDSSIGGSLFWPARRGRSRGGQAEGALRVGGHTEARTAWAYETGDGWRERALYMSLSAFF